MDIAGSADICPNSSYGLPGELFLSLINALLTAKCPLGSKDPYPEDYGLFIKDGEEFDFIVVGSGSTGSVVANKLAENGKFRVLVLEAGNYPSATSDVPGLIFGLYGTREDWDYHTESSKTSCLGFKEGKCKWPRGKVLGGSSSIHGMAYVRGNKRDYDQWSDIGNVGWNWENVSVYFKSIENLQDQRLDGRRYGYGQDGYQTLSINNEDDYFLETIEAAGMELGYPSLADEQPLSPLGYLTVPTVIKDGVRMNSARAFLGPLKHNKNLYLALNSTVTKILIDEHTSKAKGLKVEVDNRSIKVLAKKEIIISGGAVNSPQLLMLSGIGPKDHFENVGIPLIRNLPVGQNLQDHVVYGSFYVKLNSKLINDKPFADELYKYFMHRSGDLSDISTNRIASFINTKNDSVYPNIQFHHNLLKTNDGFMLPYLLKAGNFIEEVAESVRQANRKNPILIMFIVLLNPKSRGKILLNSNDPKDKPSIHTGYFTDTNNEDVETLLEGIRYAEKLITTKAVQKLEPELIKLNLPDCTHLKFRSDNYWRCAIRHLATTLYHAVGSCSMGPKDDGASVVDPRLRVFGVKNLRVADASIMPRIPSANTHAAAMMIGHKAGLMVLEDWQGNDDELHINE